MSEDWGAEEFATLAKNLILVGEVELKKELYDAIDAATRPVEDNMRRGLPDYMPDRYAETLNGDLRITTSKRTGPDPGVRVQAAGRARRRRVRRLNAGVLAHPLFGNRRYWYNQVDGVRAGFFDAPAEAAMPQVREAVSAALERAAEKAVGRL